jgi:hypothetical protein
MEQPYGPPKSGHYNLALASLICGIAGVLCCQLGGVAAVILGVMAINAENRAGQVDNSGKTMAIIGIVLGILSLLWLVASTAFMIFMFHSGSPSGPFGPHSPFRFPGMPPV